MSNDVTSACRPLQLPPTAKAVLMAMADFADDDGLCWPSLQALCEWTCYSERAVRNSIRELERLGHVVTKASYGRTSSRYTVVSNPAPRAPLNPASDCNPAGDAALPTRHLTTSTRHVVPSTRHLTTSTRQEVPPNHQEPPITISKATTKKKRADAPTPGKTITAIKGTPVPPMPDGVASQSWADWLGLRKAKSAPVTETVLREAEREAAKAGLTLTRFLEIWCSRGSQGLQADWLKPNERAGPGLAANRPSAAANFRETTYADTSIDDLPPDLRDAARAAIAEH